MIKLPNSHSDLKHIWSLIAVLALLSLGCSAGTLLVQAPLPTPTPTKTPRPVFTPTLIPTETPTPTPIPSNTPIPTATPTSDATNTPVPEVVSEVAAEPAADQPPEPTPTDTPVPAPTNTSPPPPPTNTPEPTPTPVPSFRFESPQVFTHPTGGDIEFRITAFVWQGNAATGYGEALRDFQLEVVLPSGETRLSEMSIGPNAGDSTVRGAGDNHSMNVQFKVAPYMPGPYKVTLVQGGQQMAPTIEFAAQAGPPFSYVHLDYLILQ